MNLPADDYLLLSIINTKLRDNYASLTELCEEEDADRREIETRLQAIGYVYNPTANSFK